jgi:hypothetical protein
MKGSLLFAFNNGVTDYCKMAVETAKRINHFLDLPVTLVTDTNSMDSIGDYVFDNVLIASAQDGNYKDKNLWLNKGRYRAFDLSPYDETLLLDTDYLINSNKLSNIFDITKDYMCHGNTYHLMTDSLLQEQIGQNYIDTLWATVICFKKTNISRHMFDCLEMVQNNYNHYINLYWIPSLMYRNDYALTFATEILNGHKHNKENIIPWALVHLNKEYKAYRVNDIDFNTEYVIIDDTKDRPVYNILKDMDFHCMNKETFMNIV